MKTLIYDVILADPPWKYNNRKTGGERKVIQSCDAQQLLAFPEQVEPPTHPSTTKFGGGAMKHYPLMEDDELLAMTDFVQGLANENCALFLWVTMPRLNFAIELMEAWGFRYATNAFTWVKLNRLSGTLFGGPGHYTASNVELVLVGIKGSMPPSAAMLQSVVLAPVSEHSRKPEEIHRRIDRMYPDAKKIELFARRPAQGWDVWGNEVKLDACGADSEARGNNQPKPLA